MYKTSSQPHNSLQMSPKTGVLTNFLYTAMAAGLARSWTFCPLSLTRAWVRNGPGLSQLQLKAPNARSSVCLSNAFRKQRTPSRLKSSISSWERRIRRFPLSGRSCAKRFSRSKHLRFKTISGAKPRHDVRDTSGSHSEVRQNQDEMRRCAPQQLRGF